MKLSDLRKEPHLSASSINQYIDCSLAYRFSKVDFIQIESVSDAMVFGSVLHKVVEFFHNERKAGEKPTLRGLHKLFEEYWEQSAKDNDEIQYKEGKDFESYLAEGKSLLTTYYSSLPDDVLQVIAVEEAFSYQIQGLPLPIIGAIDLIEEDESGTVIITDFKTAGRAYSSADIDNSFQLTLYGMAMKANGYHDREILLRFDCLIKTQKPKFEQYYTVRTDDDEKKALRKIMSVWDGISKSVFIANDTSWKCGGCSYKQHCENYLLT